MADFLESMARSSTERARALLARVPLDALRAAAAAAAPLRPRTPTPFTLIAEVKRASPSEGRLSDDHDGPAFAAARARDYEAGGASLISVLTEPSAFAGDLSHAAAAARSVSVPVMRKDFLLHPAQVYEARAAGCSAVLLILRMLSDADLDAMLQAVAECGLLTLIEAFDPAELARVPRALAAVPALPRDRVLLGVNTRDLGTLGVSGARLESAVTAFPPGFARIAESGMHTPADVARAASMGYTGALVGTALMRLPFPAGLVREMRRAAHLAALGSPAFLGRTRAKVCGLRTADALRATIDAGADAVGCVFAPSPRRIEPEEAARLLSGTDPRVARVAVFKHPEADLVARVAGLGVFHAMQSDVSDAGVFTQVCPHIPFIPVFRAGEGAIPGLAAHAAAALALVEGPRSGAGTPVDWDLVARAKGDRAIILAGGLDPANVARAIHTVRPAAVDVSSGVESAPGVKDPALIRAFIRAVREADAQPAHPPASKDRP